MSMKDSSFVTYILLKHFSNFHRWLRACFYAHIFFKAVTSKVENAKGLQKRVHHYYSLPSEDMQRWRGFYLYGLN